MLSYVLYAVPPLMSFAINLITVCFYHSFPIGLCMSTLSKALPMSSATIVLLLAMFCTHVAIILVCLGLV